MQSRAKQAHGTCPCHPGEVRDPRFAYLDKLIEAGWGGVPIHQIERMLRQNGGVLPPGPSLAPTDISDWQRER